MSTIGWARVLSIESTAVMCILTHGVLFHGEKECGTYDYVKWNFILKFHIGPKYFCTYPGLTFDTLKQLPSHCDWFYDPSNVDEEYHFNRLRVSSSVLQDHYASTTSFLSQQGTYEEHPVVLKQWPLGRRETDITSPITKKSLDWISGKRHLHK